jgi:hypothetical protein
MQQPSKGIVGKPRMGRARSEPGERKVFGSVSEQRIVLRSPLIERRQVIAYSSRWTWKRNLIDIDLEVNREI